MNDPQQLAPDASASLHALTALMAEVRCPKIFAARGFAPPSPNHFEVAAQFPQRHHTR
jgi:hypothetical protein